MAATICIGIPGWLGTVAESNRVYFLVVRENKTARTKAKQQQKNNEERNGSHISGNSFNFERPIFDLMVENACSVAVELVANVWRVAGVHSTLSLTPWSSPGAQTHTEGPFTEIYFGYVDLRRQEQIFSHVLTNCLPKLSINVSCSIKFAAM